jgi:hypothetical protein
MKLSRTAELTVVAIMFLTIANQASAHNLSTSKLQAGFRIKISVPDSDRPDFLVPVKEKGEPAAAIIPALLDKNGEGSQDRPSYIKIVPQREGDSVRIKVSVLYGTIDKTRPPTEQLKSLKEKPVSESLAADGEKTTISELKSFGLRIIEIEVISSE